MKQHTSGPWYSEECDNVFESDRHHVFSDVGGSRHVAFVSSAENARLIACAPELLAAVERAIDEFRPSECNCDGAPDATKSGPYTCYFHRIEDQLRQAYAKANKRKADNLPQEKDRVT